MTFLKSKKLLSLALMGLMWSQSASVNAATLDTCVRMRDEGWSDEAEMCARRAMSAEFGSDDFCVECLPKIPETSWKDVLLGVTPWLVTGYVGYKSAKFQRDSQRSWAAAYQGGIESCNGQIGAYNDALNAQGANPVLPEEQNMMLATCNGYPNSAYAGGMGGMAAGMYGGVGNGMIGAGFTPGFMGGMMGPNFGGGMYGGANVQLNPWASLAGGALAGLLTGGGIYGNINIGGGIGMPGMYGGMGGGMYPGMGGGIYGGMGMPGMYGGMGMPGMGGGIYGGMGMPGMYGGIGMPGIGGGINIGIGGGIGGGIGMPGMYGGMGMPGIGGGINIGGGIGMPGMYGGMGMPGMGGGIYGGMGMPGMYGGIGMPGIGGGINIGGGIGMPGIGGGINIGGGIGMPGIGGGINIGGGIGMPGIGGGVNIGGGMYPGGMYPGGVAGGGACACIAAPCPCGNTFPGGNGNINGNWMYNQNMGPWGPGGGATAGWGGSTYPWNGSGSAWGNGGGWQAQAQAQAYMNQMNNVQAQASYQRLQGNAQGNMYANQALYQNVVNANRDYQSQLYGGGMMNGGFQGSIGTMVGGGATAGFNWTP